MKASENLKRIRKEKKISQKELAKLTGLSVSTIQGYEYGNFNPKYETTLRIAAVLDVDPSEIDEGLKIKVFDTPEDFEKTWFDLGGGAHPRRETDTPEDFEKILSDSSGTVLPEKETQLRALISQLNDSGYEKLMEYAKDLLGNPNYRR